MVMWNGPWTEKASPVSLRAIPLTTLVATPRRDHGRSGRGCDSRQRERERRKYRDANNSPLA
jgi:hypothetical protein